MAKILEGPAMKLFNKWGIPVPNYVVIMDPERLLQLGEANKWLRDSNLSLRLMKPLVVVSSLVLSKLT